MNDANAGNAGSEPKKAVPVPAPPKISAVRLEISKDSSTKSADDAQAKTDSGHIRWSWLPFALAAFSVFGSSVNAAFVAVGFRIPDHGWGLRAWSVLSFVFAAAAVVLVDRFLARLLSSVVYRCYHADDKPGYPGIPSRSAAFSILLLQLAALVFAFAQFNILVGLKEIEGVGDAVTDAFVTATTLNHGHYNLKRLGFLAHSAVALEVSSALLFLIVFFPLLVSRLAMFYGETAPAPPPRKPVFALTVEGTVSCTIKTPSGDVSDVKNVPKTFTVTEDGEIVSAATS